MDSFKSVLTVLFALVTPIIISGTAFAAPFFCVMARNGREASSACAPTREECDIIRDSMRREGTRVSTCRIARRAYCYSHEDSRGRHTGCAVAQAHCQERLESTRRSLDQPRYQDSVSECRLQVNAASIQSFVARTGFFCASFSSYNSHTTQWEPNSACFRSEPECQAFRPGLHRDLSECSAAPEAICSEVTGFVSDYSIYQNAFPIGTRQCFRASDHCENWRQGVRFGVATTECASMR